MRPGGALATTPHPSALGSALTHPHITTDFSESQLELVTGAHADVRAVHRRADADPPVRLSGARRRRRRAALGLEHAVQAAIRRRDPDRPLWQLQRRHRRRASIAPASATATAGACRPSRASTTTGRCPGVSSDGYFALIRNFRRRSFLLLYLFGASPAVCPDFVRDQPHGLRAARRRRRCTCRMRLRCAWAGSAIRAKPSRRWRSATTAWPATARRCTMR